MWWVLSAQTAVAVLLMLVGAVQNVLAGGSLWPLWVAVPGTALVAVAFNAAGSGVWRGSRPWSSVSVALFAVVCGAQFVGAAASQDVPSPTVLLPPVIGVVCLLTPSAQAFVRRQQVISRPVPAGAAAGEDVAAGQG